METEHFTGTTDSAVNAEIKEFDHFVYSAESSNASGTVYGDGSLVLKVYYIRTRYNITTTASHEKAGSLTQGKEYSYGETVTLEVTTNAGYTWLGWYVGDTQVSNSTVYAFIAEQHLDLVARWSANTDTFYTVEYYWQNIDNNEYALKERKILMGTTDTTVSATITSYAHFMYDSGKSTVTGNIDGDGSAVLKVYYTRSSYNVTTRVMNAKAGSVSASNAYRYGKTVTVTATTNPGYTFLGWYTGNTLVSESENYRFTVDNNISLTAKWSANTDTAYTVEYYLENKNKTAYDLVDVLDLSGTTDTTAVAEIIEYAHYAYKADNSVISGNIDGRGTLVLKVYYTRDVYTITSSVENEKAGSVSVGGRYVYENVATIVASSNPGYTFIGWYEGNTKVCDTLTFTFVAEKTVTYTAKWSADDATYTVNYYKEIYTENGYITELMESVTLDSKTGETVSVIAKDIERHVFSAYTSIMTGEVVWDNSLVLEVRYRADYYRDGEYIYFGEYPQTLKANDVTITDTMDDRGYYLGSDKFFYVKIAAVADVYSPSIKKGKDYYFRVEPIRWKILSEDGENAFILCDSIIANMAYDAGNDNNYQNSDIRAWLNETFYETAFVALQQEIILITTVDNSKQSTGYHNNPYTCEDTNDKVFLLSYAEVTNTDYGFVSNNDRVRKPSVYSYATGMNNYNICWWLRSPDYYFSATNSARVVYTGGGTDGSSIKANSSSYGVVPAMWIKL